MASKAYHQENYQLHKAERRNAYFARRYGITAEQRMAIFVAQGRCCAICRSTVPHAKTDWATDHCHKTLKVRGILCHPCNKMLGGAKDNIETLKAAIKYLEHKN